MQILQLTLIAGKTQNAQMIQMTRYITYTSNKRILRRLHYGLEMPDVETSSHPLSSGVSERASSEEQANE